MEKGLKGTDMRVTLLKEAPPLFQIQWELGGRFKCQIERERKRQRGTPDVHNVNIDHDLCLEFLRRPRKRSRRVGLTAR